MKKPLQRGQFFLLLEIDIEQDIRKILSSYCNDSLFVIDRLFVDFMGASFSCQGFESESDINTYKDIHQKYVENFDVENENTKKISINKLFLDFFTNNIEVSENIAKKINGLILFYSDQVINENS